MDFIFRSIPAAGFTGIMTSVNRATTRMVVSPVHDSITAPQAADLFLHHVVLIFGMPKRIISDRGPQFMIHF